MKGIIETYPYPIAKPYSIIINPTESPQQRLWSIHFTLYQTLRIITLPLLSQYLNDPRNSDEFPEEFSKSLKQLNEVIARIRCPFFNDWISLYFTLCKHIPKIFSNPFFSISDKKLKEKIKIPEPFFALRGNRDINRLEAILALRNAIAHGGQLPENSMCLKIIEFYLPILNSILEEFSFLSKSELLLLADKFWEDWKDSAMVMYLRGPELPEANEMELNKKLCEAFSLSYVVMKNEREEYIPLYPLFLRKLEDEYVYAYDGHYSIFKDEQIKEAYINYLGVFSIEKESGSFSDLKEKLERKKIVWIIKKDACAPWTLSDNCYDYSQKTYEYMLNTKYFPSCYEVPDDMAKHFESFLKSGEEFIGKEKDKNLPKRFTSGFILLGNAGSGKTAFLTHQVEKLLKFSRDHDPLKDVHIARYCDHLTFFLRGDGILSSYEGDVLFKNIIEKIGLKAEDFSNFRELFEKLHSEWKNDRIKGRKIVIVLDALNESSLALSIFESALNLIETASFYPWCKVIISLREEFFSTWYYRLKNDSTRPNPLTRLARETGCLYYIQKLEPDPVMKMEEEHPVMKLEALSEETAKKVYENYQREAQKSDSPVRACNSLWDDLTRETRRILHNPLMLHLYMQTYGGKRGSNLTESGKLYAEYMNSLYEKKPALKSALSQIIECMINSRSSYLTEEDYHKIRMTWAERKTDRERFQEISPVELVVTEGLVRKRVEIEGGGYYFIYQKVLEYVIYKYLKDRIIGDIETYWLEKVKEDFPFPEYGGSFYYLFRELFFAKKYDFIVKLTDNSFYRNLEEANKQQEEICRSLEIFLKEIINIFTNEIQNFLSICSKLGEQGTSYALFHVAYFAYSCLNDISHLHLASFYETLININKKMCTGNPDNDCFFLPTTGLCYGFLGNIYKTINSNSKAIKYYEKAIDILEPLYKTYIKFGNCLTIISAPQIDLIYQSLAEIYQDISYFQKAIEYYEKAINIEKIFYEDYKKAKIPDLFSVEAIKIITRLGSSYSELGMAYLKIKNNEKALYYFQEAVNIHKDIYNTYPDNIEATRGLATSYNNLGYFLDINNNKKNAKNYYEKSIKLILCIYEREPLNANIASGLSVTYNNLGALCDDINYKKEAEIYYKKGIDILTPLQKKNPENIHIIHGLLTNYNNLGYLYQITERQTKAMKCYEKAIDIGEKVYDKDPRNNEIGLALANNYENFGLFYLSQKDMTKFTIYAIKAIKVFCLIGLQDRADILYDYVLKNVSSYFNNDYDPFTNDYDPFTNDYGPDDYGTSNDYYPDDWPLNDYYPDDWPLNDYYPDDWSPNDYGPDDWPPDDYDPNDGPPDDYEDIPF